MDKKSVTQILHNALGAVTRDCPPGVFTSHKQCTKCGKQKPLENFHKNQRGVFGRESHCIPCVLVAKRLKRKKNKKRTKNIVGFSSFVTGELGTEAQQQFGGVIGCCLQDLIENGKT